MPSKPCSLLGEQIRVWEGGGGGGQHRTLGQPARAWKRIKSYFPVVIQLLVWGLWKGFQILIPGFFSACHWICLWTWVGLHGCMGLFSAQDLEGMQGLLGKTSELSGSPQAYTFELISRLCWNETAASCLREKHWLRRVPEHRTSQNSGPGVRAEVHVPVILTES